MNVEKLDSNENLLSKRRKSEKLRKKRAYKIMKFNNHMVSHEAMFKLGLRMTIILVLQMRRA